MASCHPRNTGPMLASPRCSRRTRSGAFCRAPAIAGTRHCRMHGEERADEFSRERYRKSLQKALSVLSPHQDEPVFRYTVERIEGVLAAMTKEHEP